MINNQLFNRSENIQYDLMYLFYWYTARHASQAEHCVPHHLLLRLTARHVMPFEEDHQRKQSHD
jgi:hypothetical protein